MIVTNGNQVWKNPEQFEVDGIMVAWIPGYEGIAAISEDGKLWRARVKREGKGGSRQAWWAENHQDKDGYIIYYVKGKTLKAHRLVAMTYIENPNDKPIVDHINRNPADNRKENLRWATAKDNVVNSISKVNGKECRDMTEEERRELNKIQCRNRYYADPERKKHNNERYHEKWKDATEEQLRERRRQRMASYYRCQERKKINEDN